jgi:hypothetical protein
MKRTKQIITPKVDRCSFKNYRANFNVSLVNALSRPVAGFHLHRQMASCILSASKYFQYPENHLRLTAGKTLPKSAFF